MNLREQVHQPAAWLPDGYVSLAALFEAMIDKPQLIAVGGARGTGKTSLACAMANAFCDLKRRAIYRRVSDYFDELSAAEWTEKTEVRQKHADAALLVLDEVQVRDTNKEWQDNELTTLIDRRYGAEKATVLLSNLDPAALKTSMGDSIWRRLTEEGGVIGTDWPRIELLRAMHQRRET